MYKYGPFALFAITERQDAELMYTNISKILYLRSLFQRTHRQTNYLPTITLILVVCTLSKSFFFPALPLYLIYICIIGYIIVDRRKNHQDALKKLELQEVLLEQLMLLKRSNLLEQLEEKLVSNYAYYDCLYQEQFRQLHERNPEYSFAQYQQDYKNYQAAFNSCMLILKQAQSILQPDHA